LYTDITDPGPRSDDAAPSVPAETDRHPGRV